MKAIKVFLSSFFSLAILALSVVSVLAAVSVSNYTESDISIQEGMKIYKYETESSESITTQAEFLAEEISQNQFQSPSSDLEALASDKLAINHYGDNPPIFTRQDWWDDDADSTTSYRWRYRKCVQVDHTSPGAIDLYEYQIHLEFDTESLIADSKMLSNGADIRFVDKDFNQIDHTVVGGINTEFTQVWIQPDQILSGEANEYCMYYGYVPYLENPIPINLPSSTSDTESVFTYSSPKSIYYALQNTLNDTITNFASYYTGNQVAVSTYSNILSQYEVDVFPTSTNLTQTTSISTTHPINGYYSTNATDALVPASAAGTSFVYRMDRYTNQFSFISPHCTSDVEVRNELNNIVTGGAFTIPQGDFFNLSTSDAAAAGIPNNSSVIIESTNSCPIYAYHHVGSQDSFPLWPASLEWYGVGSGSLHLAALEDTTNVNIIRSDGTTSSIVLDRGEETTFPGASSGNTYSHRVMADKPVGVNQLADGDGTDATTFMPRHELGYEYFIPQLSEYVSISTLHNTSGSVDLYNDGTQCGVGPADATISITGTLSRPGFARFTSVPAGSCVKSDIPFTIYYEDDASNDEKNLWNWKQNRQFVYPEPTSVDVPSETGIWTLGSATHEWTRRIKYTVTNNSATTIEEFAYPLSLDATDVFTLAQSDGGDIRVAGLTGDGTDNQDYFVDLYSQDDLKGNVWIEIASLAPAATQDFYVYYRAIDDFNPNSLSPEIWLDGMDIDGDTNTTNNPVGSLSIWNDKSGNSHNATQSNPTLQPNINTNFIEFRGSANNTSLEEYLDIPNIDAQTFFVVTDNVQDNPVSSSGFHAIVGVDGGIYMFFSTQELGYQVSFDGQTLEQGRYHINNGPIQGPGQNIGIGNFPSSQQVFWGEYQSPQTGWDYIGAFDFTTTNNGYNPYLDLKEFIAIDGSVTSLQATNFSTYLQQKWSSTQSVTTLVSTGNKELIFSTSIPKVSYYTVDQVNITGDLTILSFADTNQITDGAVSTILDKGEFEMFPIPGGINPDDVYDVTGPLSINFSDNGTDSPVPISFSGTKFTYNVIRGSDVFSLLAPYSDAEISIEESQSGSWVVVDTASLVTGIPQTISEDIDNSGAFRITSDVPILAFHHNSGEDSKPLYPVEEAYTQSSGQYELYGIASSSALVSSYNSTPTNLTIYRSDGTTSSVTLNSANNYIYQESGGSQGDAIALRIVADGPIGASSVADSDGNEATVFLPRKEFSKEFVLPAGTQYVSVVSPTPTNTCRVYDETLTEVTSGPAAMDNVPPQTSGGLSLPFPNRVHLGGNDTSDTVLFPAGYIVRCDEAVYAYFEHHIDTSITDETTLLSIAQVRQKAEIEPIISSSYSADEEGLYYESGFDSATTGLNPTAELEWIIDKTSLPNSEHIYWSDLSWTETNSDRTNENTVNAVLAEVYTTNDLVCSTATYSLLASTESTISTTINTSPPFATESIQSQQVIIPKLASDNPCLKITFKLQTGDEAYSPNIEDLYLTYIEPTILEDQISNPQVNIAGSTTPKSSRVLKVTDSNPGMNSSTCNLEYQAISSSVPFTNLDFEFYEHTLAASSTLFNFPAFPLTPPSQVSVDSGLCDTSNDLSLYVDQERASGSTETLNLSILQNIQNLNGPLNSRDFQLNILSP